MMKFALKHISTGKYVKNIRSDYAFALSYEIEDAAKFSSLSALIRFIAGHRSQIQDYTIVGFTQAKWQECSPFHTQERLGN
jgi:hypothetical protein